MIVVADTTPLRYLVIIDSTLPARLHKVEIEAISLA